MSENFFKDNLVIDFDSTFIKFEALDELAKIALENDPKKTKKAAKIAEITNKGMLGEISFPDSLQARLELFSIKKEHIEKLILKIEKNISKSFLEHKSFFQKNNKQIYIISGGFLDYILPIVKSFGISPEHVLANKFVFEGDLVVGIDKEQYLSKEAGKVKAVQNLGIDNVMVVGDGWTDYEIKKAGFAKKFIAFSENVSRRKVVDVADYECFSFGEVIDSIEKF
jgi:D-3-phosphoglycerate dehydrogenase / 2-oxoglutarate reductase